MKKLLKTKRNRVCKDAINDAVVDKQNVEALKKNTSGTKFSPVYNLNIKAGATRTIYLRLSDVFL